MDEAKKPEKKKLTVSLIKEKRTVAPEIKEKSKEYNRIKKLIIQTLKSGEKTIPQITRETGLKTGDVTYYVMSMEKFGDIAAGDVDDDDYFF